MTTGFQVIKHNEGEGDVCPPGAYIEAHYHGMLANGKVFDSSVQRGRTFKVQIGVGQVIRGWDEGFTQLRKGEKATLVCPPDYAYGPEGHPPLIPANETLKFDVELIKITLPIRVSHIVLKHVETRNPIVRRTGVRTTRSRADALKQIHDIREKVLADKSLFPSFAVQNSDCDSTVTKGDLGWVGPGTMDTDFDRAAFGLAVGELSEVFESENGYHIIMRTE